MYKCESELHKLSPQQQREIKIVLEDYPSKAGHFIKAYIEGRRTAGVIVKCLQCVSGEIKAIRECSSTGCGLWSVRPYQIVRERSGTSRKAMSDVSLAEQE